MSRPACSIVIPVRDRRKDVQLAVASALRQTFRDFELIVVDDGSTDGSGQAALESGDGRVRVVAQPGLGVAAARNRGVEEARAPWVAFLDSDDIWRPRFLEKTFGFARSRPEASIVFSNCLSVRDRAPWLRLPHVEPVLLPDYLSLVIANEGRGMQTSTTVANRRLLREVGGFPVGVPRAEDLDAWLRLALRAPVGCVPELLVDYHNEAIGTTRPFSQPIWPVVVDTLRRLRSDGALDGVRVEQSRRLEALYLLIHAGDLIDYGSRAAARSLLLGGCPWRQCPPSKLFRLLIRSLGRDSAPVRS
jgi:glycosyltransferase involved in cell wall biosynthesis